MSETDFVRESRERNDGQAEELERMRERGLIARREANEREREELREFWRKELLGPPHCAICGNPGPGRVPHTCKVWAGRGIGYVWNDPGIQRQRLLGVLKARASR